MANENTQSLNYEKLQNWISSCVKENDYVMEPLWREQGELFKNFQARSDDVWIMTLPRSGTTLMQELVFLIMNDFNIEIAKKYPFYAKVPSINTSLSPHFWHGSTVLTRQKDNPQMYEMVECDATKTSAEIFANLPSPRLFKCHLPFSVIPSILTSNAKVIYVARNPKDRLVSWCKLLPDISGYPCKLDFKTFWKDVKEERILHEPSWKHLKEGWSQRHNQNVLFMFYEDIRQDLKGSIRRIADFLGKPCTDRQIEQAVDLVDIDNFRRNIFENVPLASVRAAHNFIGQGKIGGYKEVISREIETEIDAWIAKNQRDTDIIFP